MDLSNLVNGHLFVFYMLGQSSFNLRANVLGGWKSKICKFLPTLIVFWVSNVVSAYIMHYHFIHYQKFYSPLLTYILTILFLASTWAVTLCSISSHSLLPAICANLRFVERLLHQKCSISVDFEPFARSFKHKMFAIFGLLVPLLLSKWLIDSSKSDFHIECGLMVLYIIAYLQVSHVLFYIGVLTAVLQEFGIHVCEMCNDDECLTDFAHLKGIAIIGQLKCTRQMYLRLYKCSYLINRYFGWILLFIVFSSFYYATQSAYWVFLYVHVRISPSPCGFIRSLTSTLLSIC